MKFPSPRAIPGILGAVLLAFSALAAQPARADEDSEPSWSSLSPSQQRQLAPLRWDWSSIDTARKQKWLNLAGRLDKMPPEERRRVQERMAAWAGLPDGERTRARQQFQESRKLSLDERQARWLEYQALSPDERRELADQAGSRQQRSRNGPLSAVDTADRNSLQSKHNTMPLLDNSRGKVVAPAVVQARPGATTNPVSKSPRPAPFQQSGLPKIAATPDFVDPTTLLPRRGAQAAATAGKKTREADAPTSK